MTKKQIIVKIFSSLFIGIVGGIVIGIELSNGLVGTILGFHITVFWLFMDYYTWSEFDKK